MKIEKIRTFRGPNVFHAKPILLMTLNLEDLADVCSSDLRGFTERLVEMFPGLQSHRCSLGREGGFIERLHRGTYFAHIVEHIALELSGPSGMEVGYGKSIYGGAPGIYQVAVRFKSEAGMKFLLEKAVEIAEACARGQLSPVDEIVREARRLVERGALGPSTQAIVSAAERRGIPWTRLNEQSLLELGYGKNKRMVRATISSQTSHIGVDLAQDKDLTKTLLARASIRVPRGRVVRTVEDAIEAFAKLGSGPVAMKPLDGNHGRGVTLNITDEAMVRDGFRIAQMHGRSVIVEEFFPGKDYRILIVDGRMIAAAERVPAQIIGDGVNTVEALIARENENPLRGDGHSKPMTKITLDDASRVFLEQTSVELQSIPPSGERVQLRATANLSTGGTSIDVTDEIHPEIQRMCERAARTIGLDIAGIDLISDHIRAPLSGQRAAIIEVNAAPGIRMHHYPSVGKSRDVGDAIVAHLFPNGTNGRIPIIAITGTNGKTTTTRLTSHLFSQAGLNVGTTTSTGIHVGGQLISEGDTTGPASAEIVLADPTVEVAVLETARGGILRRGLGFNRCDIAVLTNVQPDHIGQDGIETVDDILKIKSVLADTVIEGGTLILNADDPRLVRLAAERAATRRIVFFSLNGTSALIQAHVAGGGTAYVLEGDELIALNPRGRITLVHVRDIPITINGTARFQVANSLAAIAAVRESGLPLPDFKTALGSFAAIRDNSGRGNLYQVGKGYVLVDYGHNPDGIRVVSEMIRAWGERRLTGIISAPGDRSDEMIQLSGVAAALGFDRLIVREDKDLRGRASGVTATLLESAVRSVNPGQSCVRILDECDALRAAVNSMEDGEVIVFFYGTLALVKQTLADLGGVPVLNPHEHFGASRPAVSEMQMVHGAPLPGSETTDRSVVGLLNT